METKKNYEFVEIHSIEIIENDDVYDITVENNHNFFANNILVHNCAEIGFDYSRSFCNLSEINFSTIKDNEDFKERAWAATLIGTLQASYTDFHYLSSKWQKNSIKTSLLGVSLTGVADNKNYKDFDWKTITQYIIDINKQYSNIIGINPAWNITCIKPSGTTSICLGTASGVHARYAKYYIRRLRFNNNEPIAQYLKLNIPELVENEFGNTNGCVVSIPVKSPETSIFRTESAIDTLERVKFLYENWILPTHMNGVATHNTSCTINVKENEWGIVGEWMLNNNNYYSAISVLPYDGGSYIQSPFEECTEEKYNELMKYVNNIDLTYVFEDNDLTNLKDQVACAGSVSCDIM